MASRIKETWSPIWDPLFHTLLNASSDNDTSILAQMDILQDWVMRESGGVTSLRGLLRRVEAAIEEESM